jgi:hypothetical protein
MSKLRWLLQPFTAALAVSSPPSPPVARSHGRATQALDPDLAPIRLDADTQAAIDAFVTRLTATYEPAPFAIETVLETVTGRADRQQVILVYPKGLRQDGQSRRCEELTVAQLPADAGELAVQQAAAVAHAMQQQIEDHLKQDAGWVDAELEEALKLGFPADWRDYRFVG